MSTASIAPHETPQPHGGSPAPNNGASRAQSAPRYDFLVLGGGAVAYAAAVEAAELGARVAWAGKDLPGESAADLGRAGFPAFLRAARAAFDARDAARYGVRTGDVAVDFEAVLQRVRRVGAAAGSRSSAERLKALGIDVFHGETRLSRKDRAVCGRIELRFKKALVAAQTRPEFSEASGLAAIGCLFPDTVLQLSELPRRLAVLGGGAAACAWAQAFARLGSEVIVLCEGPRLLEETDAQAAAVIADAFAREGLRVLFSSRVAAAASQGSEKVMTLAVNGQEETVRVDDVLAASGSVPDVAGLGLERAGIAFDARKGILVDDFLQTSNSKVYAAGEACAGWGLSQAPAAAARIVVSNALMFGNRRVSGFAQPWCAFTDPEVAHVGLYEEQAAAQGIETRVFSRTFAEAGRSVADGEPEGFVKLRVEKGGDRLVGATLVARGAGEKIGGLALAVAAEIGLKTLSETPLPHPTQAEAVPQVAEDFNRARLTPTIRALLKGLIRVAA